jgi:hypothetical protein
MTTFADPAWSGTTVLSDDLAVAAEGPKARDRKVEVWSFR